MQRYLVEIVLSLLFGLRKRITLFATVICAASAIVCMPGPAGAADGWTYAIINTEPEDTALNLAVNNSGQVAYVTRTSIGPTQTRHRIRVSDGITDQVVYEVEDDSATPGFFSVNRIGLNENSNCHTGRRKVMFRASCGNVSLGGT